MSYLGPGAVGSLKEGSLRFQIDGQFSYSYGEFHDALLSYLQCPHSGTAISNLEGTRCHHDSLILRWHWRVLKAVGKHFSYNVSHERVFPGEHPPLVIWLERCDASKDSTKLWKDVRQEGCLTPCLILESDCPEARYGGSFVDVGYQLAAIPAAGGKIYSSLSADFADLEKSHQQDFLDLVTSVIQRMVRHH